MQAGVSVVRYISFIIKKQSIHWSKVAVLCLEKAGKRREDDSRFIRLLSGVLGVADWCRCRNNRESDRDYILRVRGSTFMEAEGGSVQHLQWDLAATTVSVFFIIFGKWGFSFPLCSSI